MILVDTKCETHNDLEIPKQVRKPKASGCKSDANALPYLRNVRMKMFVFYHVVREIDI